MPTPDRPTSSAPDRNTVRVLILDDQRFDRHRLARLCSGMELSFDVTNADRLAGLRDLLDAQAFDLVFVDYDLPDGSGLDALEMIRLSPRNCNAATIMVTGMGQDDLAIEALNAGCSDYLTKDALSAAALTRAVGNALQKSALTTEVAKQTLRRTEIEALLQKFATECAREVKPMVSRMMRQLRDLRTAPSVSADHVQSQCETVEASCMHLWAFLLELERYEGNDLVAKSVTEAEETIPVRARASKKPPSVFGRASL